MFIRKTSRSVARSYPHSNPNYFSTPETPPDVFYTRSVTCPRWRYSIYAKLHNPIKAPAVKHPHRYPTPPLSVPCPALTDTLPRPHGYPAPPSSVPYPPSSVSYPTLTDTLPRPHQYNAPPTWIPCPALTGAMPRPHGYPAPPSPV